MTFATPYFRIYYYQLFDAECEPVWIVNSEELQLVNNVYPQYSPPLPDPPKPPPPPPKPEPPAPTVVRVPMCCQDCEERVPYYLEGLKGVETLTCNWVEKKVVVTGPVAPHEVLAACRKPFKRSEMWS